MKLASGMTSLPRLKELGDVLEMIRVIEPPRELAEKLDPSVRDKYLEFWDAIQSAPPEE